MEPPGKTPSAVPLYRALSKLGIASRTQTQKMIEAGEITVNGTICTDPERMVFLETAIVRRNGEKLTRAPQSVIMLYKPKSIITSRDGQGRPTVYSLLPLELHALQCVGRLDFATSGLLLLTNNTRLSAWLTDPANAVSRVYLLTVRGMMTENDAAKLRDGIIDNGELLRADAVVVRKASGRESHCTVTLTQGKNREIRRLCKAVGHEVTRLKRVSFGGLTLGVLQPGRFRPIDAQEIAQAFPGFVS
jgi:23S rRNA pseudouridine2605 synthase